MINKRGVNAPKNGRTEPQNGGQGKGIRISSEVLNHNSDSEGSQAALAKPDANQPLMSRWAEIFDSPRPSSSRVSVSSSLEDKVLDLVPLVALVTLVVAPTRIINSLKIRWVANFFG